MFYESEYRELCLQQLSTFNPDKMSLGYLTDLVDTTHVFIKLMEVMSKGKKMLVSKKKEVVKRTAGKKKGAQVGGDAGGRERSGLGRGHDVLQHCGEFTEHGDRGRLHHDHLHG